MRLADWGRMPDQGDAFVGFSEVRPLFVLDPSGDRFEIPASRQAIFQPDSFAAKKKPGEFRIFCLGGSTVQGRPYSIETSFTTWLELSLAAADPSRNWEVINCGGVSYASYRLVPIMKEVLSYEPDLFIVYTGHNEFLEDRTYSHIRRTPQWIKSTHGWLTDLRLVGVLRQLWLQFDNIAADQKDTLPATLPTEVDALLDYRDGLEDYHRDDDWQWGVIGHFEQNLRRMALIARKADVGLVLVNPVSNLRDSPPFKTAHRSGLSRDQMESFRQRWEEAKTSGWSQLDRKAALLQEALQIDDRHANAHYLLAKVYDAMGNASDAKAEYLRAKDEDICPLRMPEPLHHVLARVAEQTGTPLVDVRQRFEQMAESGIPGDDLLVDHVHPSIGGHQLIAQMLLDELTRQRIVSRRPDWQAQQNELYGDRWQTLDENYFPESAARLRGLRNWATGRGIKLKLNSKPARHGNSPEARGRRESTTRS